jgi:uncharacterized lipoprotein YbaY
MTGNIGNHPCALRAALCLLAAFLVAGTPSQAQFAQTKTSALAPVSLICTAAITAKSTIIRQQANMLCSAARRALASLALPPNAPVALHLTVTAANDRGAGIAGKWVFANGQACAIAPLNTRFFDKGAKSALYANFIKVLFQTNPVPSAPDISTHSIRNFRCALSAPSANLPTP